MIERASIICIVYLILEQDGKILLQKRESSGFYDGFYSLPSGHWEYGETLSEAVTREAKEELDITINPSDLEFKLAFHSENSPQKPYIGMYFYTTKFQGTIKINEPGKCSDLRFFSYDKFPDNTIPYIVTALKTIQDGKTLLEKNIYDL